MNQAEIPAHGKHKAMTLVSYVAKATAAMTVGDTLTISHVKLFDDTHSSAQQLHAAIHRTRPPGWRFNIRAVADGVIVHRSH